jgi:hypothetical protein
MTREPVLVRWPVARDDAGVADENEGPMVDAQVPDPAADAEVQHAESAAGAEPTEQGPDIEIADLAPEPDADEPAEEPEFAEPVAEEGVSTGHAEIDAALRRLDELDGLPVERHGEVYDELHRQLRDALTAAATPAPESSDD